MEIGQQFCLRWNNYQATLQHIFHKLWISGTFVDVSIVVEGRHIGCHKVVLSACSTYFEQLLKDHCNHPHPLIILHDLDYIAVESLVNFMYKGEVNVSQEQLAALLKVAETLKIKGLADSAAIANFTKYRLLAPNNGKIVLPSPEPQVSQPSQVPLYIPVPKEAHTAQSESVQPIVSVSKPLGLPLVKEKVLNTQSTQNTTNIKSSEYRSNCITQPPKKRLRQEESSNSLPPSPPISLGEVHNTEPARTSTPRCDSRTPELEYVKNETEEETDNELQIDETGASETAESDTRSNTNTPGPEFDAQEYAKRTETAESLAALASQGSPFNILQHQVLTVKPEHYNNNHAPNDITNGSSLGGKNGERTYTLHDLEEGIEAVLLGKLTPAKAIATYKIPRRTFFRRLSAVRKSRGIPSSKENANGPVNGNSNVKINCQDRSSPLPLVIPNIVKSDSYHSSLHSQRHSPIDFDHIKKDRKVQSGNVFSLLNAAANSNATYEYYLKYLKLQNQKKDREAEMEHRKEGTPAHVQSVMAEMDDNRNLSALSGNVAQMTEAALALVAQHGPVK